MLREDNYKISFLFFVLFSLNCVFHVRASPNADNPTLAAVAVMHRLLGKQASYFNIIVDKHVGEDTFQVVKDENDHKINITGSSGVAACWGLHYYLKHYCHCHVSWDGDQLSLPKTLPRVNITIKAMDKFRYYQNVVTTSYSYVWWEWERWQREIDWMALNGINLALAFTGQEVIWHKVYEKLNLTQSEINDHFCGPAFLSWCRMGNIRGWGGPLSYHWHNYTLQLQHRILQSMRQLGITPILPAFAGHVPKAFERLFPHANMTRVGSWNGFIDRYCCPYLLEPTDPLFKRIGNMFMTEVITEFETNHMYGCDTFNEMSPRTGDESYLHDIGIAIFQAMTDVDPSAIWVKQGWEFAHDTLFWTHKRAQAFLTSVPKGRMLVLDLQSELNPQYTRLESYFGQPFIWCMLHNFGGTLGLYGTAENVNKGIFEARAMNGSMVGIGLTPEGINQNYVMYDLVLDMGLRQEPVNLSEWFTAYAARRYGNDHPKMERAWKYLKSGVYNFTGLRKVRGKYILCHRPSLRLQPWYWYNTTELLGAWDAFIEAAADLSNSTLFRHDLVDVSRQALQILSDMYYVKMIRNFRKRNIAAFQDNAAMFLQLLEDLEHILGTNEKFLLGRWLQSAKHLATTTLEVEMYEFNARNQITLWGPLGEIRDYATKQWSGVVSHYYYPRWQLFLQYLNFSLLEGVAYNDSAFSIDVFNYVEQPFTLDTSSFPVVPEGDTVVVARTIHSYWRSKTTWKEAKRFEILERHYQHTNTSTSTPHVVLV